MAYKGNVKPDLSNLFVGIGLQPNIKEVKFTHIANGKFTDCLKSRKLKMVFERILNADVYLHFSSLNFLYFSLVDIVDSAVEGSGFSSRIDFGLNRILKNKLAQTNALYHLQAVFRALISKIIGIKTFEQTIPILAI